MKNFFTLEKIIILLAGLMLGIFGVVLFYLGNPPYTGICASCFIENISGALGLHGNIRMQYLRPEIMGFVLGSFLLALSSKEFNTRGSNSLLISFMLGILMLVGSAVFVGCPVKLMLRLSSGEVSVLTGLCGLILGIWIGIQFLRDGFTLGEKQKSPDFNGYILPGLMLILLLFLFIRPSFINFSTTGPGSLYAPQIISFITAIIIGVFAQRSRFCVTGSIRNFLLAKNTDLLSGLIVLVLSASLSYVLIGKFEIIPFRMDFLNEYMWEFLGMLLVGWASLFAGGCPFRQLIMSGEGDIDAGVTVFGMIAGGAIVQNFDIVTTSDGATLAGKITVLSGLMLLITIGLFFREKLG